MKKPKTVIDAEAALKAAEQQLALSQAALKVAEQEHLSATRALRQARIDADAGLPQCRFVCIRRLTGKEEDGGRMVIVRRTPTGMLVVRYVGDDDERKFKWVKHLGRYWPVTRAGLYGGNHELRDVPAEYMPAEAASA